MKGIKSSGFLAAGITLMLAQQAWAHPGHGTNGLWAGISHPLTGIDHIAAMVAVGLWAAQLGKRAMWLIPLSFVTMMIAGAALAMSGVEIPYTEQGIATSVLVLGLLIVFALRMPVSAGMFLVGLFAICHGWAHEHEMNAGVSAAAYGAGFVISTVLLHAAGVGLGLAMGSLKQQKLVRVAGAVLVVCAGLLFAGVL